MKTQRKRATSKPKAQSAAEKFTPQEPQPTLKEAEKVTPVIETEDQTTFTSPQEPQVPAVTLDDLQGEPTAPQETEPRQAAQPPKPLNEEQILGLIAFATSLGLPPEHVQAYQAELTGNPILEMFLPMLELPELLAKYGIGGGEGGPMPDWLRGTLGAALVGYVVFTTRSQYARRPERQDNPIHLTGADFPADAVPTGFTANIPDLAGY